MAPIQACSCTFIMAPIQACSCIFILPLQHPPPTCNSEFRIGPHLPKVMVSHAPGLVFVLFVLILLSGSFIVTRFVVEFTLQLFL